jgi:threonine synthase
MITQEGEKTAVASVEGNFDDAQTGVKAIFADADTNARLRRLGMRLSSANSINWGRLMPQIVYYFRAYATLLKNCEIKDGEQITFVVPTGNFGNILAGWYAREMGLPVSRFICASNSNNVLADFIRTGIYDKNRDFKVTMSPAMDILISSNLERLLYEISDRDAERVAGWMGELAKTGRYNVGGQAYNKLTDLFIGGYADEAETAAAIRDVYEKYGYLLDTHTAVGMHVLNNSVGAGNRDINAPGGKTVVAATASPYKFARDVYFAIRGSEAMNAGEASANEGDIQYIELLSRVRGAPPVPASLRNLREKPVRHFTETTRENMKATAIKLLSGIGPHTRQ